MSSSPDASRAGRLLRAMPKADLHCHLDGSLRPATVLGLARERGIRLPADNVTDLKRFIQVDSNCRSLKDFLNVFQHLYPLLRDGPAIERAAYELCEDCAEENIRHVEARFAPALNAARSFSVDQVIEAALRGLRRGKKDFGVTSGVILCLFRSHSPRENRKVFSALKRFFKPSNGLAEPGVVGMDLAGDEASYPTLEFADFYEEAARLGIPTTCHAGETVGTANLRAALALRVKRIGHGTHLLEDSRLLAEVVRGKVPLEIGLTSNVRTRSVADLHAHPLSTFHQSGVLISLNTDDRGIIGIDLTHEYRSALELGFQLQDLARLAVEATDYLFLPPSDRVRLRRQFTTEMNRIFAGAVRANRGTRRMEAHA